ncbi:MAG: hypothetical protein KIT18_05915 [Burkholderiales bacterium]|nr:hypothetical protein [Burkholderiales bacterium]
MRLLIFALLLVAAWLSWSTSGVSHPPGMLVAGAPVQQALRGVPPRFEKSGYRIAPLAHFEIEARVLRTERYRFDRGAALSPVDFALGWGRMSDSAVLDKITITQGGRFYYWSVREFPIPRREIEVSSANMHMVPANDAIEKRLKAVRHGEIVRLSGYLIEVQGERGYRWRSSLTREDTGNGACEIVWVEHIDVRRKP